MHRAMLYAVLYWVWIASEVILVVVTRTKRGGGEVRDRGSIYLLWVVIFASVWIGTSMRGSERLLMFGGAHWLRTLAVVLMAVGLAVRWTAIVTLGRSFSVNVAIHANQTLQKSGLFRVVRHPSYSGMMLVLAGIGLNTRNWLALALLVVPTGAALLYRIGVEETVLGEAFGDDYEAYSRVTKRLIPGIY